MKTMNESAVQIDLLPAPDTAPLAVAPPKPLPAVELIREWIAGNRPEFVSTGMMQKRLRLGYAAASLALDELHRAGVVGPIDEANKWRRKVYQP